MKLKSIAWLAAAFVLGACGNNENKYDATGTFEATETTVYAEQSGRLLRFDVTEGADLVAGNEVGVIDTVPIVLRIRQLGAAKEVYASQKPDMRKQVAATRQQLEKARLEQRRYTELVRDGAAPRKTLDDAVSSVNVLERQLEAQISTLQTTDKSLDRQMHATDTQVSELADQLRKCHISSPVTGCVLEKYVEDGEFVTIGKPLFKVADTKQMFLRAYVTSEQLQNVKIGQHVKVMSDYGKGRTKTYDGTVTWISSQSEFTPKTILTDDERADLVYAVKISVRNDGYLKIGMYGEVKL
ncbi:HlyD family efflux transporter periplasmic adaptor subunit [Hoylesella oralis]|uniref:HlyD family secretion protein n=1 Tax=Hoylesella oralis TaxID=28134 RepID=UPI0028E6BB2E|nr:HlyD family efflux transporter periplasmic adaptor subunit [Hoylesella oralis]